MNRVACLTQKWTERKLSLKVWADVANVYIASVVIYHLAAMHCPTYSLIRLECILFITLRKRYIPMVRRLVYYQLPLRGCLGMT